ncbi:aminotransferase class I/II-fold pyridoxal phosphate-dependent enzyme [Hoeflea sp. WL0058]|uniref:histidinol-phosphate transaminase n=1 Tax=Flavimaribacter sediminis TaxID=2865987 RepID=A0AAE3CYH1_9HYPH|nr:aminotransferase class I/II-fold pyridoxal phosphate-dependent enzyme [Flavimaribacter sediminis]MBW8635649.1 aminotransferase class I/II-fold pyridoxal phosphate-dependent enzyme [Flavimaribacter sediminis]
MGGFPIERIRAITFPPPPSIADVAGRADVGLVRMNFNESARAPSPKAMEAASLALLDANRYPDHESRVLAAAIHDKTGVPVDRMSFGNGSGEVLVAAAMVSIEPGDEAVMPAPTFPTCGKGVQIAGGRIVNVPLKPDGSNDIPAMLAAVTERTRLFYLCTPNNPTGGVIAADDLRTAFNKVPDTCMLVVDEAYFEFASVEGGPDVLSLLKERAGPWIVTRSFSKAYCMAGLRVGYALASDNDIAYGLWQLRPNFNLGRPALAAAAAAMRDEAYLQETLRLTIAGRQRLSEALASLGFEAFPSFANFLTVRAPLPASKLGRELEKKKILVQPLPWPDERGSLRITVDSRESTNRLVEALADLIEP